MHRQVERSRDLAATVLTVEELGILWKQCADHFDGTQSVISRLIIETSGEKLSFDSIEEFSQYKDLPNIIYGYRLFTYVTIAHSINISAPAGIPKVSVLGPTVAWCAGAVDMIATFAKNHRQWYWWLSSTPIFALAVSIGVAGATLLPWLGVPLGKDPLHPTSSGLALVAAVVALIVLSAMSRKTFPSLAIEVRKGQGLTQRYIGELGLLFTFLSFVAAVISIVISLRPAH